MSPTRSIVLLSCLILSACSTTRSGPSGHWYAPHGYGSMDGELHLKADHQFVLSWKSTNQAPPVVKGRWEPAGDKKLKLSTKTGWKADAELDSTGQQLTLLSQPKLVFHKAPPPEK